MNNDTPTKLHLEIVKLLVQVAWADHEVHANEVEHITELAREAGLSDAAVEILASCLLGQTTLPPPDFGFLREHRDVALAAARKLVASDEQTSEDELELLEQIKELLGH